jgi:hypothetical protein
MKFRILAIVAVFAASITFSRAGITGVTLSAYSGGMTCSNTDVVQIGAPTDNAYQMGIIGDQYDTSTATLEGYITTDGDPSLNLVHTINNDTGSIWSDYHVVVTMGQSFTFSDITVTNTGWSAIPPTGTGPSPSGPNWVGTIDFFASGPSDYLNPGDILGFSFALNFTGNVSFTETLTPSTVPEPSAIALLACGLMGLFVIQRRLAA